MMTTDTNGGLDVGGREVEDTKIASGLQAMKHIRSRRSIREFTGGRIPAEHIELILEAARHAPSPENMLMIRLIVIRDDQDTKEFLADIAQENAQTVFGGAPFELTSGRNWYIEDEFRAAVFSRLREGELFRYPEKSDTVIIVCACPAWHDATKLYPNELFGSVVAGMAIQNMWMVATAMGYGCGYDALVCSDSRHTQLIRDRIGIPPIWTPLTAFCIGIPMKSRHLGPSRPPLEGLLYDERWGKPYERLAFRKKE
ncbi:nitroreductase family protein [Candidatus Thorarchaeota archaeon]|nr:nitroreductase family protein [Candidatus Thorarchaeota archaeon]TFG98231.1 MAG: nitroreductase family protein [Candidatus Thorarchaeota archaeon]